jgi:hypothetical protein
VVIRGGGVGLGSLQAPSDAAAITAAASRLNAPAPPAEYAETAAF